MDCPFYIECAGDNKKEKARVINVDKDYKYISERREEQKTKDFKREMSVRAQVEGSISEMTRYHGLRNARYHRKIGHQLQFYFIATAVNTKRFLKVIAKQKEGTLLST